MLPGPSSQLFLVGFCFFCGCRSRRNGGVGLRESVALQRLLTRLLGGKCILLHLLAAFVHVGSFPTLISVPLDAC